MAEKEEILEEIESEIKRAKGDSDDFEIEVVEEPVQAEAEAEAIDAPEESNLGNFKKKMSNLKNVFKGWSKALSNLLNKCLTSVIFKQSRLCIRLWKRATQRRK